MLLLENWNRTRVDASAGCPAPLAWLPAGEAASGVLLLPCRRRQCPACGVSYRRYVQARLFSGLQGSEAVRYVVVTRPGGAWSASDLAAFNADSPRRLKAFLRAVRGRYGAPAYFWTAELQRRGAVHFNVLLRGGLFMPHRELVGHAEAAGFGPRVSVNLARPEGAVGVSYDGLGASGAYITKAVNYVTKGAPEWMSRRNLYGFSRDWAPAFRSRADGEAPRSARTAGAMYLSEAEAFGAAARSAGG